MLPHPLKIFKIQKYYQNEPKFYGVYSRNNLPKAKDGGICNESWRDKSIRTCWTALYVNGNNLCFYSFGAEHIPKEIKKFIGKKSIITNFYWIQEYNLIMYGYVCIRFIDVMLKFC